MTAPIYPPFLNPDFPPHSRWDQFANFLFLRQSQENTAKISVVA